MNKRISRAARLCCLLAALLLFSGVAHAGPIRDALAPLEAYREGTPYGVTLGVDLAAWPDLAPSSLDALRGWLSGASLSLHLREGDGAAEGVASLLRGNSEMFTLHARAGEVTLEVPGALPATRYILCETPISALLPGFNAALPDPALAARLAAEAAQALLPPLEPFGKAVKGGVSIRSVGTASSRVEYVL
ncbi:MAG TPA: hypothetical protein VLA21_07970, partial [Candidatus Limnocylindria bacterium]|nr:hypothetical protein [Candidatus Limnocylindria bacterium]